MSFSIWPFRLRTIFIFCSVVGGFCLFSSDVFADAQIHLNPNGRRVQGSDGSTQIEFRVQQGELLLDDRRKKRKITLSADDLARGEADISPDGLTLVWYRKAMHALGAPLTEASAVLVVWKRPSPEDEFRQTSIVQLGDLKITKPSQSVSHLNWCRHLVLDWNRMQLMVEIEGRIVVGLDLNSTRIDRYTLEEFNVSAPVSTKPHPSIEHAKKLSALAKELEAQLAGLSKETNPEVIKTRSEQYQREFQKKFDEIQPALEKSADAPGRLQGVKEFKKIRIELKNEKKVLELDLPDFFTSPSIDVHENRVSVELTYPDGKRGEAPTRLEFIVHREPLPKGKLIPGLMPNRHGTFIHSTTSWIGYCWFSSSFLWMEIRISALSADQGRWIWLGLQKGLSLTPL